MNGNYLTIEAVTQELGICRRTVFNLVKRGKLTKLIAPVGRKRIFFNAHQVCNLKKPTPFDPGTVSDVGLRRITDEFEQAMHIWLQEQQVDRNRGRYRAECEEYEK